MTDRGSKNLIRSKAIIAATAITATAIIFGFNFRTPFSASAAGSAINNEPISSAAETQNYGRFRHSVPEHTSLPCLLCHKRDDNSPTMRFSGHTPCSGCHVQQFADNKNPICSICHTETGLKRFPPLRSFGMRFSHSVHARQANCAVCHKPTRQGVAFSVPSGRAGHTTCFQCHTPNREIAGRNIGNCNVCHQPGRPPGNQEWSRAFALNFKHSDHGQSRRLNCASCHTVGSGRQIISPAATMHFPPKGKSCGACHNGERAFGSDNFANCKRCHEGSRFKF